MKSGGVNFYKSNYKCDFCGSPCHKAKRKGKRNDKHTFCSKECYGYHRKKFKSYINQR